MIRNASGLTTALLLSLALTAGCAKRLPPAYETVSKAPILEGSITAVSGDDAMVAAAGDGGLFIKRPGESWESLETPGILKAARISCIALRDGELVIGTQGEGLHILKEGVWEVRTSRYGGLVDDRVYSVAFEGEGDGLPGPALWVATEEGMAIRRNGEWSLLRPGGDWLASLAAGGGGGNVYFGSGYDPGGRGEDSSLFRPPVTAIGVGPDRVVLGNGRSRLAVLSQGALAVVTVGSGFKFTALTVQEEVIWAGTDSGLLWGGLVGHAEGEPWPVNRVYLGLSGALFGTRDSRGMEYRFKEVGYNNAPVPALQKAGPDLWVAHTSGTRTLRGNSSDVRQGTEELETAPIAGTRKYVSVDEYVARREPFRFESYGRSAGIKGEPQALFVDPGGPVWIGTSAGLWELEPY